MPETIDKTDLPSNFTLRLTSDWQLGSCTTAKELIPKVLDPVRKRKNYRIAFLGDIFDAISPRDKRFSFQDLDQEMAEYSRTPPPTGQRGPITIIDGCRDFFEDQITGIADKVVMAGIGNHEAVLGDITDPIRTVCDNLGIAYGGYTCLLRVNETTLLQLWHGRPSIGSRLADPLQRNLAVKRNLVRTNHDRLLDENVALVAQGHTNWLTVVRPEESAQVTLSYDWKRQHLESKFAPAKERWYASCGSIQRAFVPGRTSYVEAKGYSPLPLGCVDVTFRDSKIVDVVPVVLG